MWRSGKGGVHASKYLILQEEKNHCFRHTLLGGNLPQRQEKIGCHVPRKILFFWGIISFCEVSSFEKKKLVTKDVLLSIKPKANHVVPNNDLLLHKLQHISGVCDARRKRHQTQRVRFCFAKHSNCRIKWWQNGCCRLPKQRVGFM